MLFCEELSAVWRGTVTGWGDCLGLRDRQPARLWSVNRFEDVELVGTVSEEDIINIIYSYHSITKHTPQSVMAFLAEIDKVKVNDDLSLIYLLK